MRIDSGAIDRPVAGEREAQAFDVGPRGELVVLESPLERPQEVSALVDGTLTPLTRVNEAFLKGIRLGTVQRFKARSADGTAVDGFLTLPPGYVQGTRLPAILRIHGGPASQFAASFDFECHVLAAQGYAVIAANPRGSTGYGTAFSRAIWAAWGGKDVEDVLAAVDHVVGLGVGPWPSTWKSTVPVAVPDPEAGETVAVSVTAWPYTDGFGDEDSVVRDSGREVTVWITGAEVLPRNPGPPA